jgi:hypothetical protein
VNFILTRKLIIFGLVLPLAAVIGFVLATPQQSTTFLVLTAVMGLLLMPVMLKWYHPLLILSWNAFINVYFLPGQPELWMVITAVGFGIVLLNSTLDREKTVIHVPALTYPLLFLLAVVLVTAQLTGGIGVRAIGGAQIGGGTIGGKGYYFIVVAIMGYFVLTSRPIPIERAKSYLSLCFLSGMTAVVSNLAYMLGPAFYFLFYLFPVGMAMTQVLADYGVGTSIMRLTGASVAGASLYTVLMVRYGIRGVFDIRRPWRLALFAGTFVLSLFGGYRTIFLTLIVHFCIQFYFERLLRTRLCAVLLLIGLLFGAGALPFIEKMPLPVQRCFSIIPGVPVSHIAKGDAEGTTRWRTEMWAVLVGEIPKYLIIGKGYAVSPADLYLSTQAVLRGIAKNYEDSIVSGSYHSGPLSVIIPFGIFGTVGFLWLIGAGIWVLYRNYRYGDPEMQLFNTFLLSYFLMRLVIFCLVYGALSSDIYKFLGILGLSVALNRGVRQAAEELPALPAPAGLQAVPA